MQHNFGYVEADQLGRLADVRLWRRLATYGRGYWHVMAGAVLLSVLVTGAALAVPFLVGQAVDRYIVNSQLAMAARLSGLVRLGFDLAAVIVAGFVANFYQVYLLEWTGQRIMHAMRQQLFSHLMRHDLSFLQSQPTGRLVTRLTNDVQNMHEMFTSVVVTLFNDLLRIIGVMAILFFLQWRLALLLSVLLPLMLAYTLWFSRMAREAFRAIRGQLARINSFVQEHLSGLVVLQIFCRQAVAVAAFQRLNQVFFEKTLYQVKIFGIFMPVIELFHALAIGGILWFGGGEIIHGRMSLGELVAFLAYMRQFFQPLRELSQKYSIVQSALASAERLFQLLDTRPAIVSPPGARPVRPGSVEVEFRRVWFGYEPGQPVLRGLSFKVAAGETVAVVGATGAGKSTIIHLLERFYDPERGLVLVDGEDVRRLDLAQHRRRIGLVMQEVFLLPASLKENIVLDQRLSDAELARVVEQAQLSGLVAELPHGWDTRVGEGGVELSSGQKQLLAVARVLARDPGILVLDEATASIDSQTEVLIERALTSALSHRTSIIIAHRLSTVRRARRIMVLEGGRLVEEGSHQELLAAAGRYASLYALQLAWEKGSGP